MTQLEMADAFALSRTPITAGSVLADAGVDVSERITSAGVLSGSARSLSTAGSSLWAGATGELAHLAQSFLAVDLVAVLALGLTRTKELVEAAWPTRDTDERAVVELSGRSYTLTQHPSVDLMLGEATLTRLLFELQVGVAIHGLSAVVRRGRLAELTAGSVDASVRLSCDGVQLASAARSLDPQLVIGLGRGVALVPLSPGPDLRQSAVAVAAGPNG